MYNKIAFILISSSMLAACGGGGNTNSTPKPSSIANVSSIPAPSSTPTSSSAPAASSTAAATVLQGQFKDTSISGVRFVSGAQTGMTNSTGTFTYEQGKSISFSIGGITLGSTLGKPLITPIDLVENGSSTHQTVQNMVRFLLMLDADTYSENGIQLSTALQTAANNWTQIDFSAPMFEQNMTTIMTAASAADGGTHQLPDTTDAKEHLEATHLCNYSGIYQGTFTTDNSNGKLAFFVNALNGEVNGFALPENTLEPTELSAITPLQYNQTAAFETGNSSDKSSYNAQFISANDITGTWKKETRSGSVSATRVGGASNAVYRFSASFNGNNTGLLSIDIDAANKVTGSAYNLKTHETQTLGGQLTGPWLTIATADKTQLQGLLGIESGLLVGTWVNTTKGTSGNFSGSGCQLNPVSLSINGFRNWKLGSNTGSKQLIPATGTDPLVLLDSTPVAMVRMTVAPWGEMSFPITGFDKAGEAESVDLSNSSFIDITYQSNQSVNLQLRQYAVHGGTHNQITLPAATEFTSVRIPLSNFVGGLTPLDLTKVAKFNFALLSNNANDGYAELIVKRFKIDNFN
ncbi:hypothetical protein [Cellvibrio sp. UBA7671]|uniref:hypothetical protein n=1 Tax=Cellvibrio sp. UBA7671 TaxID=1946312 RepID=UPI002F356FD2